MKRFSLAMLVLSVAGAAEADVGNAYVYNMRGTRTLFHMPLDASTQTFINSAIPTTFQSFAMDFSTDANTLWAINNNVVTDIRVGKLDLVTGLFTDIAPVTGVTTAGINPIDLCIGPDGTAYYITATPDASIYTIDLSTGVCTLVAPITGATLLIDVAIDVNGNMFAHDIGADTLVALDKATGVATTIAPTGLAANFAQGMDFDWSTNTLYATIYTGAGTGQYVSWNTTTGAITPIFVTTPWNIEAEIAIRQPAPSGPACEPDLNGDGNVDQSDVACMIAAAAGDPGCIRTDVTIDPDYNRDGNVDQADVAYLLNVVGGAPCE